MSPQHRRAGRFGEEEAACQALPSLDDAGVRAPMHGPMGCVLSQVGLQLPHTAKSCMRCSSGFSGVMFLGLLSVDNGSPFMGRCVLTSRAISWHQGGHAAAYPSY